MGFEVIVHINTEWKHKDGYGFITREYVILPGKYDAEDLLAVFDLIKDNYWVIEDLKKLRKQDSELAGDLLDVIEKFGLVRPLEGEIWE